MKLLPRELHRGTAASASVDRFFQFSLLGLVTSGYLSVAGSGYLDSPTVALTAAGLLLRFFHVAGPLRIQIADRWTTAITLAYLGFFPLDFLYVSRAFLDATIHLVCFLAVMKILTARTPRDDLYVAIIAFLELVVGALLSINLNFFAFLALFLMFAIACFTSGEIRRSLRLSDQIAQTPPRRFRPRLAALTSMMVLGTLLLTAGLFFMLPRTADAAFRSLVSKRWFLPGFSNEVMLGQIGEIQTSSRTVMHVKMFTRAQPNLKWRGAALTVFDGHKWSNPASAGKPIRVQHGQVTVADAIQRNAPGRRIAYKVDVVPLDTDRLFFAGVPEVLNIALPAVQALPDGGFAALFVPANGVQYEAYSNIDAAPPPIESPSERAHYLTLPKVDPRVREMGARFTDGAADDLEKARNIERHLRTDFTYSLELPPRESADPLAEFLCERKKGHCEYFASSMAVMLRTLGIPSRIVTGFQSGIFNPISELYMIRASDAHSWVEAYIAGAWVTFDPTPRDTALRQTGFFTTLNFYLDAAQTFWQQWVVTYDLGRQVTLAERIERGSRLMRLNWLTFTGAGPRWKTALLSQLKKIEMWMLAAFACALALLLLAPKLWRTLSVHRRVRLLRQGKAAAGDATLLYARMLDLMYRRGYQKPAWFTPQEFARSIQTPGLSDIIGQFTDSYNALRFGARTNAAPELMALLDRLERQEY